MSVIQDFDRMTKVEMGLEPAAIPDWALDGFWMPYDLLRDTWREYKRSGVLLVAGGFLDQPMEWWRDIWTLDALHSTAYEENRKRRDANRSQQTNRPARTG